MIAIVLDAGARPSVAAGHLNHWTRQTQFKCPDKWGHSDMNALCPPGIGRLARLKQASAGGWVVRIASAFKNGRAGPAARGYRFQYSAAPQKKTLKRQDSLAMQWRKKLFPNTARCNIGFAIVATWVLFSPEEVRTFAKQSWSMFLVVI